MNAEGHFLFSIAFVVFAKNIELTPIIAKSDWWHIIFSSIMICLLPDIDHPKSFLGQRFKWISRPISKIFGHRGFTHSLLAVIFILVVPFYFKIFEIQNFVVPSDIIQGMILGYVSHIFADMLTPFGVPLLWPFKWRFSLPIIFLQRKKNHSERIFCIVFFTFSVLIPQILKKNSIASSLLRVSEFIQLHFSYLTNVY